MKIYLIRLKEMPNKDILLVASCWDDAYAFYKKHFPNTHTKTWRSLSDGKKILITDFARKRENVI